MARNRDDQPPERHISLDIRLFDSRQAARLLAMRIQFQLGHYADDDPYNPREGRPKPAGR